MNQYMNINRIEFSVTYSCTSRCRHCSLGDTLQRKGSIEKEAAVKAVNELSKCFNIESVMTFGGEPLLYADTTCAIHKAAANCNIPHRQVITNGYFSDNQTKIMQVAENLKESGVNSLLLSVDAFHKENIPLEKIYPFAKALHDEQIEGFKLHPAWVVNREHKNQYNAETEKYLEYFNDLHIPVSGGNNIFPAGNAAVYLSEFYEKKSLNLDMKCGEMSYTDRLDNVTTVSINPDGDVLICGFVIGNIHKNNIAEVVENYDPYKNPMMSALISGGVRGLLSLAERHGVKIDTTKHYSACGVCREIVQKFSESTWED